MKNTTTVPEKRAYHWLVAGEITFDLKSENDVTLNVVKQNCVIFSAKPIIRVQDIAKAQQTLQMQLANKMGHEIFVTNVNVTNIVILGLTSLGHMTQSEFNEAPEGTKLQPVQDEAEKVIDRAFGTA